MECLLRLWDEFDDVVAASRHVASMALDEITVAAGPVAVLATALVLWVQRSS
jgi:hypothetical protein